jgi:hypothetical protein
MIGRIRRRLAHALDRRFLALHQRVEHLAARVEDTGTAEATRAAEDRRLLERVDAHLAGMNALLRDEIAPALRIMAGNDAGNRRLLEAARADPEYERAFTEPDPLVTVIVPTNGRSLLATRALPSILAQTHSRLEVLVVGDATGPETAAAVRDFRDERLTFVNLLQRYVYPDPQRHRFAAATLARNEGYRLARGRWLFDVDDDDHVPSDAVAHLLRAARDQRLEAVEGVVRQHSPDGEMSELEPLPASPRLFGAVVHSHLRFFTREHVAHAFGVGGDVFRGERMIRAGVRVGQLDRVTYEYYPAQFWERG